MKPIKNIFITPEEFEEIQSKYDDICEYLNVETFFSSRTSQKHNRVVTGLIMSRILNNNLS
ncbi:hypothetical protein [Clostridium sp. DJ247]|uniref:hypothetical protein n=1 Tax=Clostridium sp. DJ247 TaxID=2726188 RepID=UPI001F4CC5E9|nr:hypothetical protein [Clostridium sp. DJ247]